MLNFIFAGILVGLPAGFATYEISKNLMKSNVAHGYLGLMYAAALCGFFAYWLPEGKIQSVDWRLKMPVAFALGCVIGIVSGLVERRRNKQ